MNTDWRGPINQLLHGLIFTREITDDVVADFADSVVHYRAFSLGPEVYRWAIQEALDSGENPDGLNQLSQFDRAEVDGYLRALAARLDELRPWPNPAFRRLDVSTWQTLGRAQPIAHLDASIVGVRTILGKSFEAIGDSQPGSYVLILRLQTGETVALLGSYDRGAKVTLLSDATTDPGEVIKHFTAATGFPVDKVTAIEY